MTFAHNVSSNVFCEGENLNVLSKYKLRYPGNNTIMKHGLTIAIKRGFSYINIRQVPWEVLKTEADFQQFPRDLTNINALKNHVRSLLLHKN